MALDWIKVECTLPDKPEVHAIAQACKLSPDEALGKLIRLFVWYTHHFSDGNAARVTKKTVDKVVSKWGFADAMQACGWLVIDPAAPHQDDELMVVNFERHNSKSAKRRALTMRRVHEMRVIRNADVTLGALQPSISISTPTPSNQEKTKSTDKDAPEKPSTPALDLPPWVPLDLWNAYVKMRVRIRKPMTPDAVPLALRTLEELRVAGHDVRAVLEQSIFNSWQGLFEPKAKPAAQGFAGRDYESARTRPDEIKWLDPNERNQKS